MKQPRHSVTLMCERARASLEDAMNVAADIMPTRGLERLSGLYGRLLGLAADDPAEAKRLAIFRLYLMLHAPFELLWDSLVWEGERAYYGAFFGAGLLACLGLSLVPGRKVLAVRLFVGFQIGAVAWLFPAVSNHFFLVCFCLLVLSTLDLERPAEALVGLGACRWIAIIVFFYSGLQKVLYGTYFRGEMLAWAIAHDARFRTAFEPLMPRDEAARLAALADTAGPFASEWWPLILISNFVYLFEMLAPWLLLHRRTRSAAVAAILVFMVAIETGAREVLFGCVFANLLFLFTRRNWYPVVLPLTFAVYAFLLWPRLARVWGWF